MAGGDNRVAVVGCGGGSSGDGRGGGGGVCVSVRVRAGASRLSVQQSCKPITGRSTNAT